MRHVFEEAASPTAHCHAVCFKLLNMTMLVVIITISLGNYSFATCRNWRFAVIEFEGERITSVEFSILRSFVRNTNNNRLFWACSRASGERVNSSLF